MPLLTTTASAMTKSPQYRTTVAATANRIKDRTKRALKPYFQKLGQFLMNKLVENINKEVNAYNGTLILNISNFIITDTNEKEETIKLTRKPTTPPTPTTSKTTPSATTSSSRTSVASALSKLMNTVTTKSGKFVVLSSLSDGSANGFGMSFD